MQMGLDSADRRLLLVAGGAFLLLVASVSFLAPETGENDGSMPSSYSSSPGGARAAYLVLQEMGLPIERWENSPVDLPPDSANSVLVFADPTDPPNGEEKEALLRFVESGGRVLFTGPLVSDFFPHVHLLTEPTEYLEQSYSATFPSVFTRGSASVDFVPEATWGSVDNGAAILLYGEPETPVVVSWRVGAGRILWWAGPTPLTNGNISKAGNLNLLLNAVATDTSGSERPTAIYWDEYFHGERQSLWAYVKDTPVPWGLVQIAVLGAALFLTLGLRSGPLQPVVKVTRLWPLEFVDTLGALYQRAKATPAAVSIVYGTFRTVLTRRLRLPATISDASLGDAVEKRLGWHRSGLSQTLERAAAASRGEMMKQAEALEVVQELEHYQKRLGLGKTQEEWRS